MRSGRTGRQVDTSDRDLPEVGLEIAAFAVEFGATEAGGHLGHSLGVQRDSRVALARGRAEEAVRLSRREQGARNVVRAGLDLLQADHIPRLGARKPAGESL